MPALIWPLIARTNYTVNTIEVSVFGIALFESRNANRHLRPPCLALPLALGLAEIHSVAKGLTGVYRPAAIDGRPTVIQESIAHSLDDIRKNDVKVSS